MNRSLLLLNIFISLVLTRGLVAADKLPELLEKAVCAEREERFADALQLYTRATAAYPHAAPAWAALGEHLRFYTSDAKAATAAFEKALAAVDKDPQAAAFAWRGLGELAAKAGQPAEAIRLMQKSLNALPLADTHRSLCHLYVMQRDWKNATEHARQAASLDPQDPIALLLYAAQLERSGAHAEGRAQAHQARQLAGLDLQGKQSRPVHCCVLYNLAGYHAVCGEAQRALELLEAFLKTPNHRHLSRSEIENDPDFETLRKQKEFDALMVKYFKN